MQNNKLKELVFAARSCQLVFLLVESLKWSRTLKVWQTLQFGFGGWKDEAKAALGKTNHRIFANQGKKVICKWGS